VKEFFRNLLKGTSMKKALFPIALLMIAMLPGCGGGCKDCSRNTVEVQRYGKTPSNQDDMANLDEFSVEEDDEMEYL
jgi:hypothetical protein